MWAAVLLKPFLLQFLNIGKDKQSFILDSISFLARLVDPNSKLEFEIIDEYDYKKLDNELPFPITYHIDYDKQKLYLIKLEESFRNNSSWSDQ